MKARGISSARLVAAVVLAVALALGTACEPDGVTLEGKTTIVVSPLEARLTVGDTARIRAMSNGRVCDCIWTSLDPTRATVDADGLIRAVTPGLTQVIATVRRDQNAKASLLVQIAAP